MSIIRTTRKLQTFTTAYEYIVYGIIVTTSVITTIINDSITAMTNIVISSVDVNYTPAGPAFVRDAPQVAGVTADSNPAAISLTISLQEIEMWLANDFSAEESKEFGYTGI